jgi:hypothetical protein
MRAVVIALLLAGCGIEPVGSVSQSQYAPDDAGAPLDACPWELHRVCLESEECHWYWCAPWPTPEK